MCKKEILEIIESGMTALGAESFCTCIYPADLQCNYCKIELALREARTCIILSAVAEINMKTALIRTQREIEEKLRRLIALNS